MLQKPWSVQSNCEIASKYLKIIHAHEEINRLNVEIWQLAMWIEDKDRHFKNVATLTRTSLHLSAELAAIALSHCHINDDHHTCLQKVYCLNRYTGWKPPPKALNNTFTQEPANGMGMQDIINTDDNNALCD
jgi:hypothetical protein